MTDEDQQALVERLVALTGAGRTPEQIAEELMWSPADVRAELARLAIVPMELAQSGRTPPVDD